jgi:hypothetical protein
MKPIVRALLRANDELNEEEATVPERYAVEWYVPNTRIGDGRPFNGVRFFDAESPGQAWDEFARRPEPIGEIVLRVLPVEAIGEVPPLRDVMDAVGVGRDCA